MRSFSASDRRASAWSGSPQCSMASANATRIASTAACARAISVVASVVAVNASNTFIAKSAATPWLGGGSSPHRDGVSERRRHRLGETRRVRREVLERQHAAARPHSLHDGLRDGAGVEALLGAVRREPSERARELGVGLALAGARRAAARVEHCTPRRRRGGAPPARATAAR